MDGQKLLELGLDVLSYPPYSPDCASSNYRSLHGTHGTVFLNDKIFNGQKQINTILIYSISPFHYQAIKTAYLNPQSYKIFIICGHDNLKHAITRLIHTLSINSFNKRNNSVFAAFTVKQSRKRNSANALQHHNLSFRIIYDYSVNPAGFTNRHTDNKAQASVTKDSSSIIGKYSRSEYLVGSGCFNFG